MENISLDTNESNFKKDFKNLFLKRKHFFVIVSIFLVLILSYIHFISAPTDFLEGKIINIKDRSTLRSVSKQLEEEKVIRSKVFFEVLVRIFSGDKNIVSGDYLFSRRASVIKVAYRIANADKELAPVKITIPEGFDLNDMSKVFSEKLYNFNQSNFLSKAKEGYLFPDTYFFLTTDNEEDVIQVMSDNFKKKISLFEKEIKASGKTEKEILVMASILEKESNGYEDRDMIAGILWKRIKLGMPLQVDAYMWTYKNKGLPENPICSVGLETIKSAIYPRSSPFLYYLHDINGGVHYAKTFTEHKINKKNYLK